MSTFTTYKNLEMPTNEERYNVNIFNRNSDIVDSELHKLELKNESQDNLLATKESLNSEISRAKASESANAENLSSEITRAVSAEDAISNSLRMHVSNGGNPHNVTKALVGLGNVPNVTTNDQTPTYTPPGSLSELVSGETLKNAMGKISAAVSRLISHLGDKGNPHGITKSQIGLGNADNTSDMDKPVSTAQQNAITSAINNHNISGKKHIPAGGSAGQILRWSADGTAAWGADSNTTYTAMVGATSSKAGSAGLVPAPAKGKQNSYLRGDGTWQEIREATTADIDAIIAGSFV